MGQLYDLGPYPAMLPGDDRIAGELWSFDQDQIELVRQVLDRIEGTNQAGLPNEYDRLEVEVTLFASGQPVRAEAYLFSQPAMLMTQAQRVPATLMLDGQPYVTWPEQR